LILALIYIYIYGQGKEKIKGLLHGEAGAHWGWTQRFRPQKSIKEEEEGVEEEELSPSHQPLFFSLVKFLAEKRN
jgi:hypothetical protein